MGWTQLLRVARDENSIREAVETIERNARAQTRIIEDLLEMSRIISGKTRLDVQPTDLSAVIDAAVESLLPAAEARQIRIAKLVDPIDPIMGDPARLQQVLWNLIGNAIKYTPNGGVITVSLEELAGSINIKIKDTGYGIPADALPHIFDRYYKSADSRGMGLGLSIAKYIVEAHGGEIRAESEAGKGTTISFTLPA